jgi:hypothetical protein
VSERVHGLARGRVERRDARFVSGVAQDFFRRIGVLLAHVGQQEMLTDANPARDRLTYLTGSDDHDYISLALLHRVSFGRSHHSWYD